ncbi:MAG: hypothetical protein WCS70_11645 [Verrucomicrobiota bacterium]
MKAPANIKTAVQYLASLPEPRRAAVTVLHKAIRKAAPSLKLHIAYGMIGYGTYHYRYASGQEGEAPVVALCGSELGLSRNAAVETVVGKGDPPGRPGRTTPTDEPAVRPYHTPFGVPAFGEPSWTRRGSPQTRSIASAGNRPRRSVALQSTQRTMDC